MEEQGKNLPVQTSGYTTIGLLFQRILAELFAARLVYVAALLGN